MFSWIFGESNLSSSPSSAEENGNNKNNYNSITNAFQDLFFTSACGGVCPSPGASNTKEASSHKHVPPCSIRDQMDSAVLLQQLRSNPSIMDHRSILNKMTPSFTKETSTLSEHTSDSSTDCTLKTMNNNHTRDIESDTPKNEEEKDAMPKRRVRRWLLVVIAVLTIVIIGLGIFMSMSSKKNKTDKNNSDAAEGYTSLQSGDNNGVLNGDSASYYDYTAKTDYLVGAYYYPWYGDNFHNGDGYLRKELIPAQQPALGEYDDSKPEVMGQHLSWFRKANIGLIVSSWWGPNRVEDSNTLKIMNHSDVGNLKIALHYETSGRIKTADMSNPRNDIQYMCENYFSHPNYYRIDGRPVVFIYISRKLNSEGILEEALLTMRSEASKCNHNIYLIGDQVFATAPNPDVPFLPFWYFDAVTNYDVYGSSGRPSPYANKTSVDKFYAEQEQWKQEALKENCRFVPPVSPGYNDRAVRLESDHPPLSRRLSAGSQEGSLFWYQLTKALPLVDPEVDNMILVNSFNEWHEDTVSRSFPAAEDIITV
jgi:hypothetical protein